MKSSFRKLFVITASVFFVGLLVLMIQWKLTLIPPKTSSQIIINKDFTIGNLNSKINVTVFEEPSCDNCLKFSDDVFPRIKKRFIDTNLISYTFIPLSFLFDSEPAVLASLCVLYSNPSVPNTKLFMKYFYNLLSTEKTEGQAWVTDEILIKCASDLEIDFSELISCVNSKKYLSQLKANNAYGERLMGNNLATPTVFINGRMIEDISFDEISRVIYQLQKSEK
ncbi:MAG: thioredoxin domain-containing protein [Victivallaceae bacterium]